MHIIPVIMIRWKQKIQHCLNSCQPQSESRIYKDKIDTINTKWTLRFLAWYKYLNKRWWDYVSFMDPGLLSYLMYLCVNVLDMLLYWHLLYIKNELISTCIMFVEGQAEELSLGKLYLFSLLKCDKYDLSSIIVTVKLVHENTFYFNMFYTKWDSPSCFFTFCKYHRIIYFRWFQFSWIWRNWDIP